jgi:hypothetical protein
MRNNKKLRLDWVNIGGTLSGSYTLNLQNAAGLYLGCIPGGGGGSISLDGAVFKSAFTNMEITIQPQIGVELNVDMQINWVGSTAAMIIACRMYFEDE